MEPQAVLAPGSVVPPGALISGGQLWSGVPARYVRDLTKDEVRMSEQSCGLNSSRQCIPIQQPQELPDSRAGCCDSPAFGPTHARDHEWLLIEFIDLLKAHPHTFACSQTGLSVAPAERGPPPVGRERIPSGGPANRDGAAHRHSVPRGGEPARQAVGGVAAVQGHAGGLGGHRGHAGALAC